MIAKFLFISSLLLTNFSPLVSATADQPGSSSYHASFKCGSRFAIGRNASKVRSEVTAESSKAPTGSLSKIEALETYLKTLAKKAKGPSSHPLHVGREIAKALEPQVNKVLTSLSSEALVSIATVLSKYDYGPRASFLSHFFNVATNHLEKEDVDVNFAVEMISFAKHKRVQPSKKFISTWIKRVQRDIERQSFHIAHLLPMLESLAILRINTSTEFFLELVEAYARRLKREASTPIQFSTRYVSEMFYYVSVRGLRVTEEQLDTFYKHFVVRKHGFNEVSLKLLRIAAHVDDRFWNLMEFGQKEIDKIAQTNKGYVLNAEISAKMKSLTSMQIEERVSIPGVMLVIPWLVNDKLVAISDPQYSEIRTNDGGLVLVGIRSYNDRIYRDYGYSVLHFSSKKARNEPDYLKNVIQSTLEEIQ